MISLDTKFDAILACPLCMGKSDGNTLLAANTAIAVLLVLLVLVLGSFLFFINYLAKREKKFATKDKT